jgi:hypothetical protein
VANLLKASAEHQFENGETAEIKEQAKKDAIKYFEIAKRLGDFLKTLTEEITENAKVRQLEAERVASSTKAKKNAENAAKAEANRVAREAEAELLREEEEAKTAATGKARQQRKRKRTVLLLPKRQRKRKRTVLLLPKRQRKPQPPLPKRQKQTVLPPRKKQQRIL